MLIGQCLNQKAVRECLESCLLDDNEMKLGPEGWDEIIQQAGDPFHDAWVGALQLAEDPHHHHGHEHGHHHDHYG